MKQKIGLVTLVTSALFIHGCGGGSSMLGTSDSDDYKLTPEVVTEDPTKARPSESTPVMKTSGVNIIGASGQEILLRGINLQFGDDPLGRIEGIQAIRETGSNIIRLQLRADTEVQNLEAALNKVVENNLIAILSLWEPEPNLACSDDEVAFTNAVKNLWLDEWLPVIAQDRYQAHMMINIASGWGPKSIFDGYSVGYKTYIDNYKTAIRQFRKAGFNLPLVIDAPGCGQDYHAFVSGRAKELLASDDKKNLVLSVHGYGSSWNSGDKVVAAIKQLTAQNIPVVMSEFGGSALGETPVKHQSILEKGAGDYAANITLPWQSATDKIGMTVPLPAPINVTNSEISFDVMLDEAYVQDGNMNVVMYLRDSSDRYANLASPSEVELMANQWNTRKYTVKNLASFGYVDAGFDLTAVSKFGIELAANGKAADVIGEIKIDNFKVIEGVGPEELYSQNFDDNISGWVGGWTNTTVTNESGALALTREPGNAEVVALLNGLSGIDFTQPVQISARVFMPQGYQDSWVYFKFFNNEGEWVQSAELYSEAFTVGEWTEVKLTADFARPATSVGIQMGSLGVGGASADPSFNGAILIDDFVIAGISAGGGDTELGIQYNGTFDSDVDNWGSLAAWGGASADFAVEDGALKITPKHPSGDNQQKVVIRHSNINAIENLNFAQDPFTVKTRVKLPSSYAGTDYNLLILFQDSTYNVDVSKIWTAEELPAGDWIELIWEVDFIADVTKGEGFNREARPQQFVVEINGNLINDPIFIDEIIIEGSVPVEKEEVVIGLVDFHYLAQFGDFLVDYVEGALVPDNLTDIIGIHERSAPFHWLAWSWFGNSAEFADWDLTLSVDSAEDLTPRGEEIVNGKGGIKEFAPAAPEATE